MIINLINLINLLQYKVCSTWQYVGFSDGSDGKESACNAGDLGSNSAPGVPTDLGVPGNICQALSFSSERIRGLSAEFVTCHSVLTLCDSYFQKIGYRLVRRLCSC